MPRKVKSDKDDLLEDLKKSIASITQVEGRIHEYTQLLEFKQNQINDILHYIEDPETVLTRSGCIELLSTLQTLRRERRQIKQMWEIWGVYGKNRQKLQQKDYREMLIQSLDTIDKKLQTKYNYREYTKEYLDQLNEDKPLPRKKRISSSYNIYEEEK